MRFQTEQQELRYLRKLVEKHFTPANVDLGCFAEGDGCCPLCDARAQWGDKIVHTKECYWRRRGFLSHRRGGRTGSEAGEYSRFETYQWTKSKEP